MKDNNNKKKATQLGMPPGTAANRLKKNLLFRFIQKLGLDKCFQCKEIIETVDEMSIEHKEPWLDSDNPKDKFFDLDNIAFSHLKCNIGAARRDNVRKGNFSNKRGVTYDNDKSQKRKNRWRAVLKIGNKLVKSPRVSSEEEAVAEYEKLLKLKKK